MRTIFSVALVILIIFLSGCREEAVKKSGDNILGVVSYETNRQILYDKETKVMYLVVWNGSHGALAIEIMRNPDGTPRLYDEGRSTEIKAIR